MGRITFDGVNKFINLDEVNAVTAGYIYSEWKGFVKFSDNAKYLPAFSVSGGEPVGSNQTIAPYFFVRNDLGWRVRMPEQDGEIILSGNLFPTDPDSALFVQRTGYFAFLRLEVSTRAVVISVPTAVPALTIAETALLSGIETRTDEVHTRLGLNTTKPLTNKADGGIEATGINITATSVGNNVIQTRQV